METVFPTPVASPQSPVLCRSSSGYDFGDEDAGVVAHVGVVGSSCYAEAEARVALREQNRSVVRVAAAPWRAAAERLTEALEMRTHSLQGDLFVLNLPLRPVHLSDESVG